MLSLELIDLEGLAVKPSSKEQEIFRVTRALV